MFRSLVCLAVFVLTPLVVLAQPPANCKPSIDTASLLSGVDVSGVLHINRLYARCLPMPAKKSATAYEYHPYDGGKFSTTLKNAAGQTINTFVWYGENILSLWEMSRYEIVGGSQALKKLEPGAYTLEFAVEDNVFERFPFTLSTRESGDQFKPETLYILDGLWSTRALLYAPNVDRFFQLIVWLRNSGASAGPKRTPVPFTLRLIRERDNKVIATEDQGSSLALTHKWESATLSFRRPDRAQTKDYSEFKLSEIVAVDGAYRIELSLDGKLYTTYKLQIKNGRINDIDLAQMRKENYKIMLPLTAERGR
jgi:hypothetical protein